MCSSDLTTGLPLQTSGSIVILSTWLVMDLSPPVQNARLALLLAENLAQTKHPRVEEASWRAWSERVAAVQAPLDAATQTHQRAEARTFIADRAFRASVRSAWFDLVRAKRDYANAGLNETDIHAIIPDRPAAHAAPKE